MKHSRYFDGKVQSFGITTGRGYATVGVIEPGMYTFSTGKEETMVVTEGVLDYRLTDEAWKSVPKGRQFVVPAGHSFECKAEKDVAYICYYR